MRGRKLAKREKEGTSSPHKPPFTCTPSSSSPSPPPPPPPIRMIMFVVVVVWRPEKPKMSRPLQWRLHLKTQERKGVLCSVCVYDGCCCCCCRLGNHLSPLFVVFPYSSPTPQSQLHSPPPPFCLSSSQRRTRKASHTHTWRDPNIPGISSLHPRNLRSGKIIVTMTTDNRSRTAHAHKKDTDSYLGTRD